MTLIDLTIICPEEAICRVASVRLFFSYSSGGKEISITHILTKRKKKHYLFIKSHRMEQRKGRRDGFPLVLEREYLVFFPLLFIYIFIHLH